VCFQVQKELKRTLLDPLLYPTRREAVKHSTRSIHSIQAAIEEAAIHSTLLLDQGSLRWSRRLIYSPLLLDPLLDPFTRPRVTNSTRLVDLSKRLRILLIPLSTRHLSIQIGDEEASTRPIDHSEHRHRGADFAAPSLLDPQDRKLAQTASSLLSSSESRVFNISL